MGYTLRARANYPFFVHLVGTECAQHTLLVGFVLVSEYDPSCCCCCFFLCLWFALFLFCEGVAALTDLDFIVEVRTDVVIYFPLWNT